MAPGFPNLLKETPIDERRSVRHHVECVAMIVSLAQPRAEEAKVRDISPMGCKVAIDRPMSVGSFVEIVFNDAIRTAGWVAWSRGQEFGVDFEYQLAPAAVDQLLNQAC